MKLHEVLVLPGVVSGDLWFRPVGWLPGWGCAYFVNDGHCEEVSDDGENRYGITTNASVLAGEWEAVTPDHVLGGVK